MIRVFSCVLLLSLLCAGCYKLDGSGTSARTRHNLTLIEKVLGKLTQQERAGIKDTSQFLALAEERRLIADRYDFERDGWGQIFEWRVAKDDDRTVIRVISLGPNGVFEDGQGDDIQLIFENGKGILVGGPADR